MVLVKSEAQVPSLQISKSDTSLGESVGPHRFLPTPKIATKLALIPGGGQIYNRDYWKLPIIYLSLGGGLFAYHLNTLKYKDFLAAYKLFYNLNTGKLAEGVTADTKMPVRVRNVLNTASRVDSASIDQIQRQKNYWRRYRNVALLTTGVIYTLSIIEANVAAHLKSFDISDDLTLNVSPKLVHPGLPSPSPGLRLVFNLH
ncbi:DUF5683 domain-containing protein [Dyadobacter sp. CY343]|uniref:DUF5683 domain-containing protein n=1 Tax=Dyadobacter sp. CY343 TaxID=2907299 RepID=UPI001F31331D|nr:DUF5683 domain-containing protein [Dyadobacter sp. CY343]MCE7062151.1 DUF5683 domain-containing protein [Dyadobacter sp. CY343]